jgi:hypothetical protein
MNLPIAGFSPLLAQANVFLDDLLMSDCEMRESKIKYALTWFFGPASNLDMVFCWTMDKSCPDRAANGFAEEVGAGERSYLYGLLPAAATA